MISDLKSALADISKVIELNPKDYEAHVARGFLFRTQKKYNEALDDFNKATIISPETKAIYCERAQLYKLMNKKSELAADLARCKN